MKARKPLPRNAIRTGKGGRNCRNEVVSTPETIFPQIFKALPEGFDDLCLESLTEGYKYPDRLKADWCSERNRFSMLGEALFTVLRNSDIVAIGGLNADPYLGEPGIGRLRHFYVRSRYRRTGIASKLLEHILEFGEDKFSCLTLRTANPTAATLNCGHGFVEVVDEKLVTHRLRLG